jgi:predicted Kef-type K+ transport protein
MATFSIYLAVTFVAGLLAVLVRLPPLVGFLVAGFVLSATGVEHLSAIDTIAQLGVTLLLFGVGLKLDVRTLLQREVWLTASVHLVVSVLVGLGFLGLLSTLGFGLLAGEGWRTLALLGFALSFSSTVFVVKLLEDRSDSQSLYGRITIGVLIIQDLAAVVFLAASEGELPSPWAFALVGLVPVSWLFRRIWDRTGHGELQALFGVVMALVPGYALFEVVGLKGDLGALAMGMLLASHPAAGELSRALFTVKELLLVGFFVSIGLTGLPSVETVLLGLALLLLLPLKAGGYVLLLWILRLRHRTSLLAAATLANYSEFGLIVLAVGASTGLVDEQWLVALSVAVAVSFVLSTLLNQDAPTRATAVAALLPRQDAARLHPHDRPIDVGHAQAVVMGMGRVGSAAYRQLAQVHGLHVLGVEHDAHRVARLRDEGLDVVEADATDADFWERVTRAGEVRIAILAMPFHGSNLAALDQLVDSEFEGTVAAVAQYDDEMKEIRSRGVQATFQLYSGAGVALADSAAEWVESPGRDRDTDRLGGSSGGGSAAGREPTRSDGPPVLDGDP